MSSIFTIGGKTVQDITIGAKQVKSIYDNTHQVLLWERIEPNYFYFEDRSGADNSISITKTGDQGEWLALEYSNDKETWDTWDFSQRITLPANGKVYLRGDNTYGFGSNMGNYHTFDCTGDYAVGGDVWSIMSENVSIILGRFMHSTFRYSTTLVDCSQLSIPNMPMSSVAFTWAFANCPNLVSVMESIPVTYLTGVSGDPNSEFYQMFKENPNQTNLPTFPNITFLHTASMRNILSMGSTPYNQALEYVDLSNIETVYTQALHGAFYNCEALEVVKIGISAWGDFEDSTADDYNATYNWLFGVNSTGVFCKNSTLPVTRGINYIPTNWSIADLNGKLYAPVITNTDNTITIAEAEGGASCQIFYTVDGTTPTPENGTLYTQPFTVGSGVTVKAISHYNGNRADLITDSDVAWLERIPSPTLTKSGAGSGQGSETTCSGEHYHNWTIKMKTTGSEGVTYYLNWINADNADAFPENPTTTTYDDTATYSGQIGCVEADSECKYTVTLCDADMVGLYVNFIVIGVKNGYVSDISVLSIEHPNPIQ